MEVIKNKRILALVGIGCLLLGTFLPYFTFSLFGYTKSISLWGYWEGKVVLTLTLANALFIFKDFIEKYIPQLFNNGIGRIVEKANNPKFSLVPTILVAGFAIYMLVKIDVDSEYLKYGLGFWVLWIGILSLVGHAIFYKKSSQLVAQEPIAQQVNYQQVQSTQQVNYQQPQPTQQPVGDPSKKYWPQCRNQVDSNATTCFMCGHNF